MTKDDRSGEAAKPGLGGLDVDAYLSDPARKQEFVTPMFDIIAPRYDAFTRLFSLGMDVGWKADVIDRVVAYAKGRREPIAALDLACGTGDIAVAIARHIPTATVTAVDASPRMITEAEARLADPARDAAIASRLAVRLGDMCALDVDDASMDVVSAGYGVRNVPDARVAVREMARVLRPGGLLVTLDFYRPRFMPWRAVLLAYLRVAGNLVGWWWHREPVVYGYIARSIDTFMSWQDFGALLVSEGFRVTRVTRHLGGGIAVHECVRV